MIKFFRKIRQNLLMENKTGKYLKYAIGEIILVVIGILIALSINNWNERRKDRIREYAILMQLQEEYTANLEQLEAKMQLRNTVINCSLKVLKYMETPKIIGRDSVLLFLSGVNNDPTFDPIQNDLISSGSLRLIRNQKLKKLLSSWTSDLIAVQEQEEIEQMMIHEIIRPLFNDIGITRDLYDLSYKNGLDNSWKLDTTMTTKIYPEFGSSLNTISSYKILSNRKLEGAIANTLNISLNGNEESTTLKKRILNILELIKTELKNKKNI